MGESCMDGCDTDRTAAAWRSVGGGPLVAVSWSVGQLVSWYQASQYEREDSCVVVSAWWQVLLHLFGRSELDDAAAA